MIETNSQISVYEQGEWISKGRYTAAARFDEDVEWIKEKKDYSLSVCYVSEIFSLYSDQLIFIIQQEQQLALVAPTISISATTPTTCGSTPTTSSGSIYKNKMIVAFNILAELTEHKVIPFLGSSQDMQFVMGE